MTYDIMIMWVWRDLYACALVTVETLRKRGGAGLQRGNTMEATETAPEVAREPAPVEEVRCTHLSIDPHANAHRDVCDCT